jgi:hypothetical protein
MIGALAGGTYPTIRENGFGQRSAQRHSRSKKAESRQEEATGAGTDFSAGARQIEVTNR